MQRELAPQATEGLFIKGLNFTIPPSYFASHLPLHKGGLDLVPLKRVYVIIAWLAGQYTAHLCVASNIRAMPETEIPPAMRVDFYSISCSILSNSGELKKVFKEISNPSQIFCKDTTPGFLLF